MAITAASIEANGWVLRLTLAGSLSSAIVAGFNNSYATQLQAPDTAAQWATNFSAYALAPNSAAPALVVSATSNGFVQSGGQAVASSAVARSLIGTKPVRKPVDATAAGLRRPKTPDEVDNGDGTITVRIALSQTVYATDTGLSLAALAGWRTGSAAQTIAVTNNSTVPAPAPIVRWSDVPYQLQSGSFALECVVAAFHPNGVVPVAGVKFTVTDGTTIKTFWATALSTSAAYTSGGGTAAGNTTGGTGQGLRVYSVTVDPTTATALTRGLLRCDFKVFPWIGPAKASDTADTNLTAVAASNASPSMTGLGTAALATAAQVPFVVAYNPLTAFTGQISGTTLTVSGASGASLFVGAHVTGPGVAFPTTITALGTGTGGNGTYTVSATQTVAAGTAMQGQWIPVRYAYVDATNGAASAAANRASLVAATAASTPVTTVNYAIESLRLQAATVAAANGQSAISQSLDGCRIRLVAGVAFTGTNAVTFGANTLATWLVVEGDPANANPVASSILRSPASANGATWVTRIRFANLSVEAQTNAVLAVANAWMDGCEYRGVSGQTATTGLLSGASGSLMWLTNGKWWQHGSAPSYASNQIVMLARTMSVERSLAAPLVANCARLPTALSVPGLTGALSLTDAGLALERIAVGNDLRYLNNVGSGAAAGTGGMTLANASAPSSLQLGTTYPVSARYAALNNVGEVYGTAATLWSGVGENATVAASEFIIEGNTWAGDRTNNPYNDVNDTTVALNDTDNNQLRSFRFANNVTMKNASKHDAFADGFIASQRVGVLLSSTRNKAYAAGAQVVIPGFAGTGSISGTTLTVTAVASGALAVGSIITVVVDGQSVTGYGTIAALGTGTGGTGTYTLAAGATALASSAIRASGSGSPSNIYQCTTAGTTASTGGPTGTGSSITDGGVTWQWVTTETRCHGYRPQATGVWASAHGVGYEGNIDLENANDPLSLADFFFEFYGVGSQSLVVDGINLTATPFTNDQSGTPNRQPYQPAPSGSGGGDYRPLASTSGSYILGRARTASVDRDQRGVVRNAAFAAGAFEGTTVALAPASDRQASRAASSAAGWTTTLATASGRLASRAATSAVGWTAGLAPAGTHQANRAASPAVGWATTIVTAGGRLASRAAASLAGWATTLATNATRQAVFSGSPAVGWTATLATASGRLASTATSGAATWAVVLAIDGDRSAMAAAAGQVTWSGWLAPAAARSAMLASSPAVTAFGTWLIAVDSGRIAIVDQTLPILLPGWSTPADRTLIVTGDFRNITVD